jgi:hypothetical protein
MRLDFFLQINSLHSKNTVKGWDHLPEKQKKGI